MNRTTATTTMAITTRTAIMIPTMPPVSRAAGGAAEMASPVNVSEGRERGWGDGRGIRP